MNWMWKVRIWVALGAVVFCIVFVDWSPSITSPAIASIATTSTTKNDLLLAKRMYSFPKWEGEKGIQIDDVLAFAMGAAHKLASTVPNLKTRLRFPETLYVLDKYGIWVSFRIRTRHWKPKIDQRVLPSERIMHEAWKILNQEMQGNPEAVYARWPRVAKALYEGEGIPFLTWYGDYKSCNLHNWQTSHGNRSVPLFTPAVPMDCHHGFPMPNFKLQLISQDTSTDWENLMEEYRRRYPWDEKIPKGVWRGSLSAPNEDLQSVRWRLCQLATVTNSSLLDVGLTTIPERNHESNLHLNSVGGLVPSIPQEDFQRYIAIIDVDGNSWSSRFPNLLCYNSVVIKVEPQYVEYYYRELQPWVHYIPVKYDLSDLTQVVDFTLGNPVKAQEIVHNANVLCQEKMIQGELGRDFLDVLEEYVRYVSFGDGSWSSTWSQYKQEIFAHESFDMRRIEGEQ